MRIRKTQNSKVCSNYFVPLFKRMVVEVRKELAEKYDVSGTHPELGVKSMYYRKYRGLCEVASSMMRDKIIDYAKKYHIDMAVNTVHGEIAHDSYAWSKYWQYQHTWLEVLFPNGCTIYIDPTSSQFQSFLPNIPDYYVSYVPLTWYYADRDNPRWNRWVHGMLKNHPKLDRTYDRIVCFFQYDVWGFICDYLL